MSARREDGLRIAAERLGLRLASLDSGRYRLFDAWGQAVTEFDLNLDDAEFYIGHEPVARRRVEEFVARLRAEHPPVLDETLRRIDGRADR